MAVVVGPNGSGKSNVADAIVWASGSLAPHELRAEKPDDVLFAGSRTRKQAEHCEVELLFDNGPATGRSSGRRSRSRDGCSAAARASTSSTRRRSAASTSSSCSPTSGSAAACTRSSGRARSRRSSARRPSERRVLLEEAAGLGKFKARRHRAELKLARVATQVERARDVEEEVRKRLRPLALQASAAERAEKLVVELGRLRARIAQLDLEANEATARRGGGAAAGGRAGAAGRGLEARGTAHRAQPRRGRARGRGRQARGGDRRALPPAQRRASGSQLRRESADGLLVAASRRARATAPRARRARAGRARSAGRARAPARGAAAGSGAFARGARRTPAGGAGAGGAGRAACAVDARRRAGDGARGRGRASRQRASALVADDVRSAFALLERARASGLGSLTVVVEAREPDLPVVPKEALLSSTVPAVTRGGLRLRPHARRALVRGRDRGGGAARAGGAPAGSRGGGRASCAARAQAPIPAAAYSRRAGSRGRAAAELAERLVRDARRRREPLRGAAARACGRRRREVERARLRSCGGSAATRPSFGATQVDTGEARDRDRRRAGASGCRGGRGRGVDSRKRAPNRPRATTATRCS